MLFTTALLKTKSKFSDPFEKRQNLLNFLQGDVLQSAKESMQ